jgi:class 3 adenylate cyclase
MSFEEIVDQAMAMLQRRGRVAYRTLKRQFQLDEDALEDLKTELIKAQRLAMDEDEEVLVWTGDTASAAAPAAAHAPVQVQAPLTYTPPHLAEKILAARPALEGERKQVTVFFADIKDSTRLIEGLDPRSRPAAPRSGPSLDDGRRAPLRGHGEPGAGRWHYGPLRRPHRA